FQGELQHRRVKRFYARTNKIRTARQIARLSERDRALRKDSPDHRRQRGKYSKAQLDVRVSMHQRAHEIPSITPDMHHWISHSRHSPVNLRYWLRDNNSDPALKNFTAKLKDHILGRLRNPNQALDGTEFSSEDRQQVIIQNNRIYRHHTLRVNYTTYDIRRDQDCMNPRNHADVMTLSHDVDPATGISCSGHPFAYARLLDIYHVPIFYCIPGQEPVPRSIEVLFVRHYRLDSSWKCGFQQKRLPRVHFRPADDPSAFGFVDPDEVIRGAHIIPAFAHGQTEHQLNHQTFKHLNHIDTDWRYYYVNWYVYFTHTLSFGPNDTTSRLGSLIATYICATEDAGSVTTSSKLTTLQFLTQSR
ncbi:hypothetical protein K474DRAFT_1610373, partial [Panus rudis PR-1116 ss-1]